MALLGCTNLANSVADVYVGAFVGLVTGGQHVLDPSCVVVVALAPSCRLRECSYRV